MNMRLHDELIKNPSNINNYVNFNHFPFSPFPPFGTLGLGYSLFPPIIIEDPRNDI